MQIKKIKITPVTIAHGRVILQFLVLIYHSKLSNTNFIKHFPVECTTKNQKKQMHMSFDISSSKLSTVTLIILSVCI